MRISSFPLFSTLLLLALLACGRTEEPPAAAAGAEEELAARAGRLARKLVIVDTHVDFPWRQWEEPVDVTVDAPGRNFDYPKARAGGLDAPFMSIYTPAALQDTGEARGRAEELIDLVEALIEGAPDKFALARTPAEVEANFTAGRISLPLGMENGEPIQGELGTLRHFFERGIRYIGLAHSENNHLADSSYATERRWNGLSPFGREVVAEMNRLGIMVDVSHLSDDAFDQVMETSRAPAIASHSSCRRFTPGWERNIGDEMIQRLAGGGGVVMINFGSAFLTEAAYRQSEDYWREYQDYVDEHGLEVGSADADEFSERYWSEHERIYATIADVADHIDHVVELVGVDHVGFGSDFDGVGDSLPPGLKDVSGYPNLIEELLRRGYGDEEIGKICGGNLLRVWRQVERVAAEIQASGG